MAPRAAFSLAPELASPTEVRQRGSRKRGQPRGLSGPFPRMVFPVGRRRKRKLGQPWLFQFLLTHREAKLTAVECPCIRRGNKSKCVSFV